MYGRAVSRGTLAVEMPNRDFLGVVTMLGIHKPPFYLENQYLQGPRVVPDTLTPLLLMEEL